MEKLQLELTNLIKGWQSGDKISEDQLFSATYSRFREIAKASIKNYENKSTRASNHLEEVIHSTTSLVHDAYMKLSNSQSTPLENSKEFYLLVSKTMRHILVDFFRKRNSKKKSFEKLNAPEVDLIVEQPEIEDFISLNQMLDKLNQVHTRPCEAIQLKYFFGLKIIEIAYLLEVSESTVEKELKFARCWIKAQMNKEIN